MDPYLDIASPEIYFIGDTHFHNAGTPGEQERRRRFFELLESVPADSAVFLLGDIFDFYFEYSSVVLKRYFDIFHALYQCGVRGVDVHFLGGNHDYWVGDFLSDEIGLTLHWGDEILIHAQGRRVCCAHGDLVLPGDGNYRRIRAIIRNRYIIRAARFLHPDLMRAIATRISNGSRHRKAETRAACAREMAHYLAETAAEKFFTKGNDVFVMGHVHHPIHRACGGNEFMIVGDWVEDCTFGRLAGGKLRLETAAPRG